MPLYLIAILILLLSTSACKKAELPIEELIHGEVYFMGNGLDENPLIQTLTDTTELQPYLDILVNVEALESYTDISVDLTYKLTLQTTEETLSYDIGFDLGNKIGGVAHDSTGYYPVPFEWVDLYLDAYRIPEQFTHLQPPSFTLMMDDYVISTGLSQEWYLQPTPSTLYPQFYSIEGYELRTMETLDFTLTGLFDRTIPNQIRISITDNMNPSNVIINDYELEETISTSVFPNLPKPKETGDYHYEIECTWDKTEKGYHGTIKYMFNLIIEMPTTYQLNSNEIIPTYEPGDSMAILIKDAKDLDYRVETEAFTKTIGLFYFDENQTDLVGLIPPLNSRTKAGDYSVMIYRDSTNELLDSIDYTVIPKEFDSQQLTVSSSTASLKSSENREKDNAKFGDAKSYSEGSKLWEDNFLMPIDKPYRISTEYSMIRYVNGDTESSRHSGLDIAVPEGTPIKAANSGYVTFASDLIISGNVIVIDHGLGLFTSYVHLYKIHVEDGDFVEKGDIIGEVGSTGYSTGPHLHWTVWKNGGVYLNPWKFVEEDPLAAFSN